MQTSEITLQQTVSIWWSLVWRATLVGVLVGFVLGALAGVALGLAGYPHEAGIAGALLGWLGSIPVSMWALYAALKKPHGGYSVALVRPA